MLELIKAVSLGLVVILPLANPLTTVALFLGLAGEMNFQERNRQARQASIYVFAIMMVVWYANQHSVFLALAALLLSALVGSAVWVMLKRHAWRRLNPKQDSHSGKK